MTLDNLSKNRLFVLGIHCSVQLSYRGDRVDKRGLSILDCVFATPFEAQADLYIEPSARRGLKSGF
jgi:hypothetical protein